MVFICKKEYELDVTNGVGHKRAVLGDIGLHHERHRLCMIIVGIAQGRRTTNITPRMTRYRYQRCTGIFSLGYHPNVVLLASVLSTAPKDPVAPKRKCPG